MPAEEVPRVLRADARRSERTLLAAAAALFAEQGVTASTRAIAARAGVGMGTLYRRFPTRGDLVAAVYRQQVEDCAAAASTLLAEHTDPADALRAWIASFVDLLVTKHGLAAVLPDEAGAAALHRFFLDRLVPACASLLEAAGARPAVGPYGFLRGVGNLCIGGSTPGYEPLPLALLLVDGVLAGR